uniref:Putative secreted protein n=1 Tax=Anopheles marajoara TaxID=58244 RepID=A0A2M4C7A3_9DIPT
MLPPSSSSSSSSSSLASAVHLASLADFSLCSSDTTSAWSRFTSSVLRSTVLSSVSRSSTASLRSCRYRPDSCSYWASFSFARTSSCLTSSSSIRSSFTLCCVKWNFADSSFTLRDSCSIWFS